MGEDALDGQAVHGDLKAGGLVIPLDPMGAAVAGSRELAGSVEVHAVGKTVAVEDVVKHLEAGVTCLLRCEQPLQWPAGGIVGAEDQGQHGEVRSEPRVRATIEKEHGAELGLAFAAAAMVMTVVLFRTEVLASEPAADGLAAQVDSELIG